MNYSSQFHNAQYTRCVHIYNVCIPFMGDIDDIKLTTAGILSPKLCVKYDYYNTHTHTSASCFGEIMPYTCNALCGDGISRYSFYCNLITNN